MTAERVSNAKRGVTVFGNRVSIVIPKIDVCNAGKLSTNNK